MIFLFSIIQERYERITHSRLDRIFEGSRKFCRIGTVVSVLTPILTGLWAIYGSLLEIYKETLHFLPLTYTVMQNYLLFTFWLINVRIMSKLIREYGKNFEQVHVHTFFIAFKNYLALKKILTCCVLFKV